MSAVAILVERRVAVAALVVAALLATSCGSHDDLSAVATPAPSTTTTTPMPTPTPTHGARSAGCGTPAATGTHTETLLVDGVERKYVLTIPEAYHDDQPAPLLFDFHGLGANAEVQSRYSGLGAYAATRGYVVITPTGSGNDQRAFWILPGLPGGADVAFFDALRAHVEATVCVDPGRVYAAGMSNGGAFASGLACDSARTFGAIASVSGLAPCRNGGPAVPVIAFHGTADPIYPYDGGPLGGASGASDRPRLNAATGAAATGAAATGAVARDLPSGLRGLQLPPVEDTVARWATQNGCDASPKRQPIGPDVEVRTYERCIADVVFYRIDGGGHSWPGTSADVPLGPTTRTIDANELIVDFFEAH